MKKIILLYFVVLSNLVYSQNSGGNKLTIGSYSIISNSVITQGARNVTYSNLPFVMNNNETRNITYINCLVLVNSDKKVYDLTRQIDKLREKIESFYFEYPNKKDLLKVLYYLREQNLLTVNDVDKFKNVLLLYLANVKKGKEYDEFGDCLSYLSDWTCNKTKFEFSIIDNKNILLKKREATIVNSNTAIVYPYHENYARFCINGKYGYLDLQQNIVVEPIYDYANDVNEGYALVNSSYNNFYLINFENKQIVNLASYCKVSELSDGVVLVANYHDGLNLKYSYLDLNDSGKKYNYYNNATPFYNGMAVVDINSKPFIINKRGVKIDSINLSSNFERLLWNNKGVCVVNNSLFSLNDKKIISKEYIHWEALDNGYFVCSDFKTGSLKYNKNPNSGYHPFLSNYSNEDIVDILKTNPKLWGFGIFNKDGILIYEEQYGCYFLKNKSCKYDYFVIAKPALVKGIFRSRLVIKYGLINSFGIKCFDFDFDYIDVLSENRIQVVLGNKKYEYYIDDLGNKHKIKSSSLKKTNY